MESRYLYRGKRIDTGEWVETTRSDEKMSLCNFPLEYINAIGNTFDNPELLK